MEGKLFIYLFIFLLMGASPVVMAEKDPSFQFNTEFDLKRACFDDGFFCGTAFVCNITLVKPDGSLMINNSIMTNQGSFRNITIPQTDNDQLGFVTGIESCSNVTNAGPDTFTIQITGDGNEFLKFPHQFTFIIFALVMVMIGMITDRLRMFKHLGSMFLMVMGVLTLFPGYSFINYSNLLGLSLGSILIGLGFYFLIEDSFSRDKQEDSYDSQSVYVDDE